MEKNNISKLIIVRGLPGSGKTTLSEKIKSKVNDFYILDPDNINKKNFFDFLLKYKLENIHPNIQKYRFLFSSCIFLLKEHKNIIWNQPFINSDLLNLMLNRIKFFDLRFKLLIIELIINQKIAYSRVKKRKDNNGHGPSLKIFKNMYENFEFLDKEEYPIFQINSTKYIHDFIIWNFLNQIGIKKKTDGVVVAL